MLTLYSEIAGKYNTEQCVGVSRLPYASPRAGLNIFQGGFFTHDMWEPRVRLQQSQSSMQAIWKYEMNYVNACGYWLGLQKTCYGMLRKASIEAVAGAAGTPRQRMLQAWSEILGEYALRVLAVRQEFYRNSVSDPVGARLNQSMYEEDTYRPVSEALDDRTRELEKVQETQLMKAVANLMAHNSVKRADGAPPES